MIDRSVEMEEASWWDLWNSSYRAGDNLDATASELFVRVASAVNQFTSQGNWRVLEVACGTGSFSRMITCSSYHGLDVSPAAIAVCWRKAEVAPEQPASRFRYEVADIHDWPTPADPFDLAVCVDAVSCFRDQPFALRRIAQSLRPAGRLVLTTINPFVYNRIKRTAANPLQNGPVSHWLSRAELHGLITSAGFAIDRSYTIMPRGNRGIWRLINSPRVYRALGKRGAREFRRLKESAGLGQYRVVVAHKRD